MEEMSIGKRIMNLRKQKGLTQEQLAERVGVSAQAVSKWENDVSCPDISIIPMLASELGVSTDELLGVKPIEPHVVVVESGKENKKRDSHYSFDIHGGDKGGIIFAALLILVGVAFFLNKANVLPLGELSFWGIVWPAVLLGLGVAWMLERFSVFSLGVSLLGLYFLLFNLGAVAFELTWSTIWPILLILFGLSILFDKLFPNKKKARWLHVHNDDHEPVSEYTVENGFIRYECSFCNDKRAVNAEICNGGDVDISFGEGLLDLSACKTASSGAVLRLDVSFASFTLIVPRTFRVSLEADKSFGSVSTKGEPLFDATETLRIIGDVSFGSMMIKYV